MSLGGTSLRFSLALTITFGALGCGANPDPVLGTPDAGARVDRPAGDLGGGGTDTGGPMVEDSGPFNSDGGVVPPTPVVLRSVPWNATNTPVGTITTLVESGDDVFLFGQRGMQLLAGGVIAATDDRAMTWRDAALVPSGDRSLDRWVLGVDGTGRVYRVSDRSVLEDVTGRYGLMGMGRTVRTVAAVSDTVTAFGFDAGFALADGTRVMVWNDPSFASLVAGGGRLAARTMTGVRVFDPATMRFLDYAVAGVTGVALNAIGKLTVVTQQGALYQENPAGALELRWESRAPLRAVRTSGMRTWVIIGANLGLVENGEVRTATETMVPDGSRLVPSPSTDIWVITPTGAVSRYGLSDDPRVRAWEEQIRPIYARRCTPCHLPGGTAGIDFSTYRGWVNRAADIRTQAIVRRLMPPMPMMTTEMERATISAWLDTVPVVPDGGMTDATVADAGTDGGMDAGARDTGIADTGVRDTGATDTGMRDVPPDQGTPDAGMPTFAQVYPIITRACVGCHGGSGSLNMGTQAGAYTALVNTLAAGTSCRDGTRVRVVPNNPMASLFYLKVAGMTPCGNPMPRGAPALPAIDLATIRAWIAGGAMR